MAEDSEVSNHCIRVYDGIDWGVNFVFEGEDVPTDFAVCVLEHSGVEASMYIGRIVLRVCRPDGGFDSSCEVVPIKCVRWSRKTGSVDILIDPVIFVTLWQIPGAGL